MRTKQSLAAGVLLTTALTAYTPLIRGADASELIKKPKDSHAAISKDRSAVELNFSAKPGAVYGVYAFTSKIMYSITVDLNDGTVELGTADKTDEDKRETMVMYEVYPGDKISLRIDMKGKLSIRNLTEQHAFNVTLPKASEQIVQYGSYESFPFKKFEKLYQEKQKEKSSI